MKLSITLLIGMYLPIQVHAQLEIHDNPIFPLQRKHVHSSSIVECPNGDLLACWFHGSGERTADDVVIQGARLKKGSKKWSPVFLMADTPDFPDCNPVIFIDRKERLWLFWITVRANGWEHSILKYRMSTDYQRKGVPKWDWQDIILLKPGDIFAETIEAGFKELITEEPMWAEYAPLYSTMIIEAAKDKAIGASITAVVTFDKASVNRVVIKYSAAKTTSGPKLSKGFKTESVTQRATPFCSRARPSGMIPPSRKITFQSIAS